MPVYVDWARVSQEDLRWRGQGEDYMRLCEPERDIGLLQVLRGPLEAVMLRSNVI